MAWTYLLTCADGTFSVGSTRDREQRPERRIHGWSRAKKQALIDGRIDDLKLLARNYTDFGKAASDEASSGSATVPDS
jgi:predicted GIY-YIG superfamily endonuclease